MPLHNSSIILTSVFVLVFLFLLFRFVYSDPEQKAAFRRLFCRPKAAEVPDSRFNDNHSNDVQPMPA